MLTGEYVVLDGATALVLPTKYGQTLEVSPSEKEGLHWQSIDENGEDWFEIYFTLNNGEIVLPNPTGFAHNDGVAEKLLKILNTAKGMNPEFLNTAPGFNIKTKLDFPRNWGLGTSSTLINNIAQWANVDAFKLLWNSFGGSGFDIAAAKNDVPIFYEKHGTESSVNKIHLPWDFKNKLFFIHLNKKQDSKKGIEHYKNNPATAKDIERISDISKKLLLCYTIKDFENLMESHEQIISGIIKMKPVKQRLFTNFKGTVKSLGAWGGDFVLATGTESEMDYFRNEGFGTIVPFSEMVK